LIRYLCPSCTNAAIISQEVSVYVNNTLIGTDITDSNGNYSISWIVETMDDATTIQVHANYSGNTEFNPSTSIIYSIVITPTTKTNTQLTLDNPPTSIQETSWMTFTGRLIQNDTNNGISGQTIFIYYKDGANDEILETGITDSNGYYSIPWIAAKLDDDDDVEIYAKYSGNTEFNPSITVVSIISIIAYSPQSPLTPTSPMAWQTLLSTHQLNVNELCDDFGSAAPHPELTFGKTDNFRCYIAIAMWDLSDLLSGIILDDINKLELTFRGAPTPHCLQGGNCDPDPDPAEIRFIISSDKCYSGVSHHTTVYWRSTEEWETSVDDWIPLTPNIYNTNQTSVDLISLLDSITSDGYLCLAFSQSGVDGPPHLQNTHAIWRINDLQINVITIPTILEFDQPVSSVILGEHVTFTGRLTRSDTGAGLGGMLIKIYESDDDDANCFFDCDRTLLATGTTLSDGSFSIQWASYCEDSLETIFDSCILELYAEFSATVKYAYSQAPSGYYPLEIIDNSPDPTVLTLDTIPSIATISETIIFTGRITHAETGVGISGRIISIKDFDGGFGDDLLAQGITNADGYYTIPWEVEDLDLLDDILEIYAIFEATDDFEKSETNQQTIEILTSKINTEITLDNTPSSVSPGDFITLSGQLLNVETGAGIPNELVYIVEYDNPGIFDNDDTILWSGLTNSNGEFSFNWEALCVDDNEEPCTVELYTYYNGSDIFKKSWLLPNYREIVISVTISTSLILDNLPPQIQENTNFTFTGRLTRDDTGEGISGKLIYIYDADGNFNAGEFGPGTWSNGYHDDVLAIATTNSTGHFIISWISENTDTGFNCYTDCSIEIYAFVMHSLQLAIILKTLYH